MLTIIVENRVSDGPDVWQVYVGVRLVGYIQHVRGAYRYTDLGLTGYPVEASSVCEILQYLQTYCD